MKLEPVVITKNFKVGNYIIKLKDEIIGRIITPDNYGNSYFRGNIYRILLDLGKREASLGDVKEFILDLYLKGIKNARDLTKEELALFYFIKDVKDMTDKKKTMLFIGYEHNYVSTIKNTMSQFSRCECIELKKNLEMYQEYEYDKMFNSLIKKANDYDKIILDIPNVYLLRNKYNTKKLIDHLLSQDKKVLLLINRYTHVFLEIFGDKYKDNIIDRKYVIYNGHDQSIVNHIKKILF